MGPVASALISKIEVHSETRLWNQRQRWKEGSAFLGWFLFPEDQLSISLPLIQGVASRMLHGRRKLWETHVDLRNWCVRFLTHSAHLFLWWISCVYFLMADEGSILSESFLSLSTCKAFPQCGFSGGHWSACYCWSFSHTAHTCIGSPLYGLAGEC